jgi:GT2 family glycosyltransferase
VKKIKNILKKIRGIFRVISDINFKRIKKGIKHIKKNGIKSLFKKIFNHYLRRKNSIDMTADYRLWIKNNEPTFEEIEEQRKYKFEYNPKISIVVPMFNTPKVFFCELIDCILNQTYSNFELCLADGTGTKADYIDELIKDSRIKYKLLKNNGGISVNTNEALKMATGDYIALLDHDDKLPLFALYEIVKTINENKDVDFIYTDEDKFINSDEDRYDPHFKPDYSPDLLTSYNYITHFSIFKKELMDKLVGFRKEYDGAQDYDIILRATEIAEKIIHIPKILYNWRVHPNSVAGDSNAKMYAYDAGLNAIQEHLKRKNIDATVEHESNLGVYRVKYNINEQPLISIIISNKDCYKDLGKCLNSISKSTYQNYEIIIVENNSTTNEIFKFYEKIQKNDKIKVVYYKEKGFNYSKINNFGVKSAKGDYILLLNNDTEVINKNWLEEMLSICQREDVGIVGSKLLYYDNTVQHAGVVIGMGGIAGHINKLIENNYPGYYSRASVINNYSAVTAACMLVKKEIFEKVNGLSEDFKVAFNDIDFCLKVRELNKLVVYTPYAKLYHYESKSRGYEDTPEKQKRFQGEIELFREKWNDILKEGDPYFNKNFRLDMPIYYVNSNKINN